MNFITFIESSRSLFPSSTDSSLMHAGTTFINDIITKSAITRKTMSLIWIKSDGDSKKEDFIKRLIPKVSREARFVWRLQSIDFIVAKSRPRAMSLFLIKNFDEFMEIYWKMTWKNFKLNGFNYAFNIWLLGGKIKEVHEMFDLLWRIEVFNVNVMYEDENGEVLVETFEPFDDKCADTTPRVINKFKNGKFEKNFDEFLTDKVKNLQSCPVRVAIANDIPFTEVKEPRQGRDIKVINALAGILNFTVNYTFIGPEGFFLSNGTAMGPLKALMDNDADISISDWWLKENRLKFFDATSSYISDSLILNVPHGRELTELEKLVYPFDGPSWTILISFILVGVAVIFIIKKQSKTIQNFVFGRGVQSNSFNFFRVFLGVSSTKLPSRNFARYLLMCFVIYSLVIRTVYQASFYKLMKTQKSHEEIKTMDEVIKSGFPIYLGFTTADLAKGNTIIAQR
jgi:hypothetical protein